MCLLGVLYWVQRGTNGYPVDLPNFLIHHILENRIVAD